MEGIVRVLQAARHLSHTHLAHGEGYGLLVSVVTHQIITSTDNKYVSVNKRKYHRMV